VSTATGPTVESLHFSLIDDLLELRDNPFPRTEAELVAMLSDVKRESPAWRAHHAAVDAALDLLVPALQRMHELPSPPDVPGSDRAGLKPVLHAECVRRVDIRGIVGHIPKRESGRYRR
jgi:hypothetical protein